MGERKDVQPRSDRCQHHARVDRGLGLGRLGARFAHGKQLSALRGRRPELKDRC